MNVDRLCLVSHSQRRVPRRTQTSTPEAPWVFSTDVTAHTMVAVPRYAGGISMKLAALATFICVTSLGLAHTSPSQVDVTKTGPLSRKVTKEDRQGIEALFKAANDAWRKGDIQALAALYDFPIYMGTDRQDGTYEGGEWSQEQFNKIMGSMMKNDPKDVMNKEKLTPHFLSDTLAVVLVETTLTKGGKELGSYKSSVITVKKSGQWRVKSGIEAGHGTL
jgi:uncharacterized protein (TIGR02246 family)